MWLQIPACKFPLAFCLNCFHVWISRYQASGFIGNCCWPSAFPLTQRADCFIIQITSDLSRSDVNSGWGDGEVAESLLSHGFGCCCWCLKSWLACRQWELRRDDARSDPSHELLEIFNKVCQQGETSHTLPCFHPFRRKQKMILACMSSSYLLLTMPCLCISKDLFTPSAIPGNSARNACWHFLTSLLGGVSSQQWRQKCRWAFRSIITTNWLGS